MTKREPSTSRSWPSNYAAVNDRASWRPDKLSGFAPADRRLARRSGSASGSAGEAAEAAARAARRAALVLASLRLKVLSCPARSVQ